MKHRHCFHQATDADPLRSGPRTVVIIYVPEPAVGGVGAVEAAQTLAWPNSDMSVLTKFTAVKTRYVLPGELVHSDVL